MSKTRFALIVLTLVAATLACGPREEAPADTTASTSENSGAPKEWPGPPKGSDGWAMKNSAFKVQWEQCTVAGPMAPGSTTKVDVRVKNVGDAEWPDREKGDPILKQGAFAVRLSYRWLTEDGGGSISIYGPIRGDLSKPVQPGETATIPIEVTAPSQPGRYQLQFDLVQEFVSWFEGRGAEKCMHLVEVK